MPKLIIIRGNSGSGKTTVAKELQKRLGHGTMLISQDAVRREMIYVKDEQGNKAVDLLQNLVAFAREHCDNAILEGILSFDKYEKLFTQISEIYSDIHAYYYDICFEETIRRHSKKPNAGDFGEKEMRRWWKEKDLLPTIPEKILTESMSMEYIVDMILNDVL